MQGLAGGAEFLLLGFELLFAFDQLPGLLFDAGLAGGAPVANFGPFGGDQLVLHLQTFGELEELVLLLGEQFLFLFVLLAELQAEGGDGAGDFGAAEAAGDLGPELFGDESHFERLAVDMADLGSHLFHRDPLPFDDGLATFDFAFARDHFQIGGGQLFVERGPLALHLHRPLHALAFEVDALVIETLLLFAQLVFGGFELAAAVGRFELELLALLFDEALPKFFGPFAFLAGGGFFVGALQLPERLGMRQGGVLAFEFLTTLPQLQVERGQFFFARDDLFATFIERLNLLLADGDFGGTLLQIFELAAEFPFALLKVVLSFALPKTGGAEVGFELSDAGVELSFAAIDLAEAGF